MSPVERAFRIARAENILGEAGEDPVLRTVAHLPALLQSGLDAI